MLLQETGGIKVTRNIQSTGFKREAFAILGEELEIELCL